MMNNLTGSGAIGYLLGYLASWLIFSASLFFISLILGRGFSFFISSGIAIAVAASGRLIERLVQ